MKLGWLKAITSNVYPSARHLNWHAHDELEMIFPLRGHYRYEFKGRETVYVNNESFIIIPPGVQHRFTEAIDPPGGRLHLYLQSPSSRTAFGGTFTRQEYAHLYKSLSGRSLRSLPSSPQLKTATSSLGKLIAIDPHSLSDADRLHIRFLCCLALCNGATSTSPTTGKSTSQIFAEAVDWLKRNYSAPIRMDQLIAHIGYSRARFFALFKRQTKMTPSEYLRNYRLEKAKEMLMRTDLPANHIGKACGLGDPAHFSRLFSKMTGHTPLSYRQANKMKSSNR